MFGTFIGLDEEADYIKAMDASGHLAIIDEKKFPEELEFKKFSYIKPPEDIDYLTIDGVGFRTRYINGAFDLISPNFYAIKKLKVRDADEIDGKIEYSFSETDFLFLKKFDNCIVIAPRVSDDDNFEYFKTARLSNHFGEAAAEMLVL